jgi:glycosyltransferase involved in cell wall biosynthesis
VARLTLSIVIPCFNEERYVEKLLRQVLSQRCVDEVIIVDDASTDGSLEIIRSIRDKRLVILSNKFNQGKGACVRQGFEIARSDVIGIQDADLEYNPSEYSRLIKPIEDGRADAVFGSRFLTFESRRVLFFWHRVGNQFLTLLANITSNLDLTDMETCFKFISSDFAKGLDIQEKRFGLEPEITLKLSKMRARIYEVPISYSGRTYQEGKKIGWKDGVSTLYCIAKYKIKRFKKPEECGRA